MSDRVALYCRVSTEHQSLEWQEQTLRQFAEKRGWEVVAVFLEQASGRTMRRKELARMRVLIRQSKLDRVLVWSVSRLGRSLVDIVVLMDEMFHSGVSLIAVGQEINTESIMGRGIVALAGALAEAQVEEQSARIKEGIRRAKNKGVRVGRPKRHVIPKKVLRRLLGEGLTAAQIASYFGCSKSTAHRAIRGLV